MKMHSNILEKVRIYEEKRGITYPKTDGKLYNSFKVLYVISLIYTLGVNLLFLLGCAIGESIFEALENSVYTVIALSVLLIASLVIMRFRKFIWVHIVTFLFNVLSSVGLCFTFATLLKDVVGFKPKFYYCHLVPLCLMVIFTVVLTVVAIRAILKTQKNYKIILENLYSAYNTVDDGNISNEEWDEILKGI